MDSTRKPEVGEINNLPSAARDDNNSRGHGVRLFEFSQISLTVMPLLCKYCKQKMEIVFNKLSLHEKVKSLKRI